MGNALKTLACVILVGGYFLYHYDKNTTSFVGGRTCDVAELPYSDQMKNQIWQLCDSGFTRSEAIDQLQSVYRKNIKPEMAVQIIKAGRDLEALRRNPDPWRN